MVRQVPFSPTVWKASFQEWEKCLAGIPRRSARRAKQRRCFSGWHFLGLWKLKPGAGDGTTLQRLPQCVWAGRWCFCLHSIIYNLQRQGVSSFHRWATAGLERGGVLSEVMKQVRAQLTQNTSFPVPGSQARPTGIYVSWNVSLALGQMQ